MDEINFLLLLRAQDVWHVHLDLVVRLMVRLGQGCNCTTFSMQWLSPSSAVHTSRRFAVQFAFWQRAYCSLTGTGTLSALTKGWKMHQYMQLTPPPATIHSTTQVKKAEGSLQQTLLQRVCRRSCNIAKGMVSEKRPSKASTICKAGGTS